MADLIPAAPAAQAPAPAAPVVPAPAAPAPVVPPIPAPAPAPVGASAPPVVPVVPAGAPAAPTPDSLLETATAALTAWQAGKTPELKAAAQAAIAAAKDTLGEVKLTLPVGSPLKQADVDAVAKIAAENHLSQPQAELMLQQREATYQNIATQYVETERGYLALIKADPEMGSPDDAIFKANMEHAKIGLKQLVPEADLAFIEKGGFGNMPWIVRAGLRHYQTQIQSPNLVNGMPIVKDTSAKDDSSLAGWAKDLYPKASGAPGASGA